MKEFRCQSCGKLWYCSGSLKYQTNPRCDLCNGELEEIEIPIETDHFSYIGEEEGDEPR